MDDELVRRIRAARGYAGLSQPALAGRLGVSKDTLARIERGERALRPLEERNFPQLVAEATDLPVEFFTESFAHLERAGDDTERTGIATVTEEIRALRSTVDDFTRTWAEEALPVIARLQTDAPPAEDGASAPTSEPTDSRAGGQAG